MGHFSIHLSIRITKLLLIPLCLVSYSGAYAQNACDSLQILSVEYKAVDAQVIEMVVLNESSLQFNYPEFILYDQNSNMLAKDSSGIYWLEMNTPQSQFLHIAQGVQMPNSAFDVELELFTTMTSISTCYWDMNIELCPTGNCQLAEFYLIKCSSKMSITHSKSN